MTKHSFQFLHVILSTPTPPTTFLNMLLVLMTEHSFKQKSLYHLIGNTRKIAFLSISQREISAFYFCHVPGHYFSLFSEKITVKQ